jgi:hypothetical protein
MMLLTLPQGLGYIPWVRPLGTSTDFRVGPLKGNFKTKFSYKVWRVRPSVVTSDPRVGPLGEENEAVKNLKKTMFNQRVSL